MNPSAAAAVAIALALLAPAGAEAGHRNCVAGACPEIRVLGDGPALNADGSRSRASGFADPALAHLPRSKRIWMVYSWPHYIPGQGSIGVDNHLAYSDDKGHSWRFDRPLWVSQDTIDPLSGLLTHYNQETVSLHAERRKRKTRWYSARTRYLHDPITGIVRPSTYQVRVAAAGRPQDLGLAEEASLGVRSAINPVDVDLPSVAPELAGCSFSNPGLQTNSKRLFLAVQCQRYVPGGPDVAGGGIAIFSAKPRGAVRGWRWDYRGLLTDYTDAVALGGDQLQAIEFAEARKGKLLAIVTVAAEQGPRAFAAHLGCRALRVRALGKAQLVRTRAGAPKVTHSVDATDLPPDGPGTCGYAERSKTGIVLARRDLLAGTLVTSLHSSRLRP